MRAYGGTEKQVHTFLIPSLAGGRWWVSRSWRFDTWERASPIPSYAENNSFDGLPRVPGGNIYWTKWESI